VPSAAIRHPDLFRTRYGSWAVVTGASSGLGREMAGCLAAAGLHVVIVARREDVLRDLATQLLDRYSVEVRVLAADLATTGGRDEVHTATADLDVGLLVAAAGFGTSGLFLDAVPAEEAAMLEVNCRAVLDMTRHFAQRFVDRGRGGIVLFASLVGRQGTPYAAHYAATKAYVLTLAEGLHRELAPHHVDVIATAPGPVHSGFADRAGMTMGRAATPAQIAAPTLNALGRRAVVVPGLLSTVLTWSLAPLPRSRRTQIMSVIMRGMTGASRRPSRTAA